MRHQSISRRSFVKMTGISVASFLFSGCNDSSRLRSDGIRNRRPNIVLILADDIGYADPGCMNPESKIPTPNIDLLAREGMRFTDAHSPSAVCSPTRYGILTGRYCWRSRLKRGVLIPGDRPLIEKDRLTLAGMLKKYGYNTACIGKWHLGWDWPTKDGKKVERSCVNVDFSKPIKNGPIKFGFDYYFGDDVPNYPPYCYIENDRTIGIPSVMKPKEIHGNNGIMLDGWDISRVLPDITEKAVEYIVQQSKSKNPFFLYFPLTSPHTPIVPTEKFIGKSDAGRYGDYVHQTDFSIGQVLKALKENGLEENTLVIVTSDNGSPARDGTDNAGPICSVKRYGHNPSGILRGIKADIWEGGHRVPLCVRWPGKVPAGSVCNQTVCLVDIMATTAAVVGEELALDSAEDSYNILPLLLGKKVSRPIREATVLHSGHGVFSIRQGNWKLILGRGSGGFSKPHKITPRPGEPAGQLYNLREDISETNNLYEQRPDIVQRLTGLLEKYKQQGRSVPVYRHK